MPDNARYGMLRGMWVRKEIYNDLIGGSQLLPADASIAEAVLGTGGAAAKATSLWKLSKVALNPPTQIRNFVSNAVLLNLSGTPLHRVPQRMVQAINSMVTNDKYWQVAKQYGVTGNTTFANVELLRIRKEFLDIKADSGNPIAILKKYAAAVGNAAGDVFQITEGMYKTAKIIDAMEGEGMDAEAAALSAHAALFDYSLVPKSVRYLRSAPVGMPFASFYYFALGKMLQVAIKHPMRMAPYAALPFMMSSLIAAEYDVDEEDVEKLKQALPGFVRERGNAYFLPWKDKHGRWQAVNIGYFFPWAMFTELYNEAVKGDAGEFLSSTGLLGGPLPDLIAAVKTNRDSFTKREIATPGDPGAKQVADVMLYLWRMAAPTWVTDVGVAGHAYRTLTGAVNPKTGDPLLDWGQVAGRMVGFNVYPINPEESRQKNLRGMKFDINKIVRQRARRLKNVNLNDRQRGRIKKQYNDLIAQRHMQMSDYAKASGVHPNLRTEK